MNEAHDKTESQDGDTAIDEQMKIAQEEMESQIDSEDPLAAIEELSNKELTYQLAIAVNQLTKLTNSFNSMVHYVNNLQENPAFVGGILSHINELHENQQVFFIELHQDLSEEDQKKCYRVAIFVDHDGLDAAKAERKAVEEAHAANPEADDLPVIPTVEFNDYVTLQMEVFAAAENSWQVIIDDDPIQATLRESIIARLLLAEATHGEPYFIKIHPITPTIEGDDGSVEESE